MRVPKDIHGEREHDRTHNEMQVQSGWSKGNVL